MTTRIECALFALLACCLASEALAQNCPTRPYWPTTEWQSRADEVKGTHAVEVQALDAYAFPSTAKPGGRSGVRSAGLLVVKGGEIVYERYGLGADETKRQNYVGFGKTVIGALVGVAVADGALALTDSVCTHLEHVPAENCAIQLSHLMDNTSGLTWQESHLGAEGAQDPLQHCSVVAMMYGEGRRDMAHFVLDHSLRDPPGQSWQYSNGDGAAMSAVVVAAMNPRYGERWPWALLLDRIGARRSVFSRDPQGTLIHWSATLRDLARFGYLYLNDGCWDGVRLLPESWVADGSVVPAGYRSKRIVELWGTTIPGRLWWINRPEPELGLTARTWPNLPEDAYFNVGGFDGTFLVVVPSLDLVVAYWGDNYDGTLDQSQIMDLALTVAR